MNFMNSPGANILRALGVGGPWQGQGQQQGAPPTLHDLPNVTQPPMQPMNDSMEGANGLAYKRPDGLFKKLLSIFGGA